VHERKHVMLKTAATVGLRINVHNNNTTTTKTGEIV